MTVMKMRQFIFCILLFACYTIAVDKNERCIEILETNSADYSINFFDNSSKELKSNKNKICFGPGTYKMEVKEINPTKKDLAKPGSTLEEDKGKGVEPPKTDEKPVKDIKKPEDQTKKDDKPPVKPTEPPKQPEATDSTKPSKDKPKEDPIKDKPTDKTTDKSKEKPTEKPTDKTDKTDKSTEKPSDKTDKTDKTTGKDNEKSKDKLNEKDDKSTDESSEKPTDNKTTNLNQTDSDLNKGNTTSSITSIFNIILDTLYDEISRAKKSFKAFKNDMIDWYNEPPSNKTNTTSTTSKTNTTTTKDDEDDKSGKTKGDNTTTTTKTKTDESKGDKDKSDKSKPSTKPKPTIKYYKDEVVSLKGDKTVKLTQYDVYKDEGVEINGLKDNEQYIVETKMPEFLKSNKPITKVGIYPAAVEYIITLYYNNTNNNTIENEIQQNKTILKSRDIQILDINECILPQSNIYHHQCHNAAKCINLKGSYTCQCSQDTNCTECDGFNKISNSSIIKGQGYISGSGCLDRVPPIIELVGSSFVHYSQCGCGSLIGEVEPPVESEMCDDKDYYGEESSEENDYKQRHTKCFKAYDNVDGDLTSNVTYIIRKKENENDTYEIIYTVKDKSGNVGNVTRIAKRVPQDVKREMDQLKLVHSQLDRILNDSQNQINQQQLVLIGFYILAGVSCYCVLILTGLSRTLCNCFKYLFFPTTLLINRSDFENGVDCYLRLSHFGFMDHATRQSIIKEEWENAIEALNSQVSQE